MILWLCISKNSFWVLTMSWWNVYPWWGAVSVDQQIHWPWFHPQLLFSSKFFSVSFDARSSEDFFFFFCSKSHDKSFNSYWLNLLSWVIFSFKICFITVYWVLHHDPNLQERVVEWKLALRFHLNEVLEVYSSW